MQNEDRKLTPATRLPSMPGAEDKIEGNQNPESADAAEDKPATAEEVPEEIVAEGAGNHFRNSRFSEEELVIDDEAPKSFLKRYFGLSSKSFIMYLPKTVNIANSRINVVFLFLELVTIAMSIWFFVGRDQYSVSVTPDVQVTMCGRRCEMSPQLMDAITDQGEAASYCSASTTYTNAGETHGSFECPRRCGRATNASACLLPSELMEESREEAFIPTSFRQTLYTPKLTPTTCPTGYSMQGSQCMRQQDYFVPGVEKLPITFQHEFVVYPVYNSLSFRKRPPPLKAHSGAFHAEGWDSGMLTVLFSPTGSEIKRFAASQPIELTVEELLTAAYVTGGDGLTGNFDLDTTFTRTSAHVDGSLPTRLTGMAITIDIWATSSQECELHHTLQTGEPVKVTVEHTGPIACMSVHADMYWVTRSVEQPLGTDGTLRIDDKHGIHISFRKSGSFYFLEEQAFIRSFSALLLWFQFPVLITYWFCMLCLGTLSSVYRAVVHQEVNVAEALKGFSARLLTYSSAFMDLRSRVKENSGSDGITKKTVAERVSKICEHMEVEDAVIERISHVIFESLKSFKKENAPTTDVVTCQEFCAACSTNEPVQLGTLVKIFDKDRRLGLLERVFLDESLAEVRRQALAGGGGSQEEEAPEDPEDEDAHAAHSRVVQAYRDVQFMLKDLGRIEQLALQTAQDLDVNPSTLGLVGSKSSLKGGVAPAIGSIVPKLKRSVSADSIGNEASADKRDYRDIER